MTFDELDQEVQKQDPDRRRAFIITKLGEMVVDLLDEADQLQWDKYGESKTPIPARYESFSDYTEAVSWYGGTELEEDEWNEQRAEYLAAGGDGFSDDLEALSLVAKKYDVPFEPDVALGIARQFTSRIQHWDVSVC